MKIFYRIGSRLRISKVNLQWFFSITLVRFVGRFSVRVPPRCKKFNITLIVHLASSWTFFVVLVCHLPKLDGFDWHFQASLHSTLSSIVNKSHQHWKNSRCNFLGTLGIEPGPAGWEARMLPLYSAAPRSSWTCWLQIQPETKSTNVFQEDDHQRRPLCRGLWHDRGHRDYRRGWAGNASRSG